MLICLYGEIRDALWPEHGLSGSMARCAPAVAFRPVATCCEVARARTATAPARRVEVFRGNYRGSEFVHAKAQERPIQMVLSELPSSSFKRSKPRLDQNRTARAFALLTPTCSPDSLSRGAGHPLREQHGSSAMSLNSLQQVQMQMCWIELDNLLRGTLWVIDSVCAALVRGPFGRRPRGRIGILSAKLGPPFSLQSLLPFPGVRRADGKPGDALVVLDDKRQPRFEKSIRRGIDVTDQLAILV
jgi:hypothetical protein